MSQYSELTAVCLDGVLANLPLTDLFGCAEVNRHWREGVIAFCQLHIHSMHIMTDHAPKVPYSPSAVKPYSHLLTNSDGSRMFPSKPLKILHSLLLSNSYASILQARKLLNFSYTNLKQLRLDLVVLNDGVLAWLLELVSRCPRLESFHLSVDLLEFPAESLAEHIQRLLNYINHLPKLRRLSVLFHPRSAALDFEPQLSALVRLHELSFECNARRDILRHSLLRYAPANADLRRISYKIWNLPKEEAVRTVLRYSDSEQGASVASRFTLFPFGKCFNAINEPIDRLFPLLSSLTYVWLYEISHWHQTVQRLASLTGLIHLRLDGDFEPDVPEDHQLDRLGPRLPSVRILEFTHAGSGVNGAQIQADHAELDRYQLSWYFPGLEALEMRLLVIYLSDDGQMMCGKCAENARRVAKARRDLTPGQIRKAAVVRCAQAVISGWKTSGTLKYLDYNGEIIDLENKIA